MLWEVKIPKLPSIRVRRTAELGDQDLRTQCSRGREDPEVTSGAPGKDKYEGKGGEMAQTGPFPVPTVTHSPTLPPGDTLARRSVYVCTYATPFHLDLPNVGL